MTVVTIILAILAISTVITGMIQMCMRTNKAADAAKMARAVDDDLQRMRSEKIASSQMRNILFGLIEIGSVASIAFFRADRLLPDAFWLSTIQRTSLTHLLMAILSLTAARLWETFKFTTNACITDRCFSYMSPLLSVLVIGWDILDLAFYSRGDRNCRWFCGMWWLSGINVIGAFILCAGWTSAAGRLIRTCRNAPSSQNPVTAPIDDGDYHYRQGYAVATILLSITNAALIAMMFIFSVCLSFSGPRPDREQKLTEVTFFNESDIFWDVFTILYFLYVLSDSVIQCIGQLEPYPAPSTTLKSIEASAHAYVTSVEAFEGSRKPLAPIQEEQPVAHSSVSMSEPIGPLPDDGTKVEVPNPMRRR